MGREIITKKCEACPQTESADEKNFTYAYLVRMTDEKNY